MIIADYKDTRISSFHLLVVKVWLRCFDTFKVSSQSRKSEFRVFSIVYLYMFNF